MTDNDLAFFHIVEWFFSTSWTFGAGVLLSANDADDEATARALCASVAQVTP